MKVIEVINSFSPGGAEILVKEMAKLLKERGVQVEVWGIGINTDEKFEMEFIKELQGHHIGCFKFNKKPHKERLRTIVKIRKKIKEIRPDIIHVHGEAPMFYISVACTSLDIPLIQTIHSTVINEPFLQKYYFNRKLKKFIAVSAKIKKILINKLKIRKNKISLIYNGIDIHKFRKRSVHKKNEQIKLVNVGRLAKEKDQECLIKSLFILKNKYYKNQHFPFKLIIVGVGELEAYLKDLTIEYGLQKFVHFLGAKRDIPSILMNSDIFILSSKWEGFPLVILEAMASKLPIISTNVGSISEIIENGKEGILVPKESPEKLANAIHFLSKDYSLREKLSRNAYKKVKSKFSIQVCVQKHLELYEQILYARDAP